MKDNIKDNTKDNTKDNIKDSLRTTADKVKPRTRQTSKTLLFMIYTSTASRTNKARKPKNENISL